MNEFVILIVILIICALLCGPVALVIALIALNKTNELTQQREVPALPIQSAALPVTSFEEEEEKSQPQAIPATASTSAMEDVPAVSLPQIPAPKPAPMPTPPLPLPQSKEAASFEQAIGTRWLLIAGILSVIAAAGFFLKYAYDQNWLVPWLRVTIVAAGGLLALAVGEFTRRRGYDIAARGTTALGFALLYGATFAAYRAYELVDTLPAFAVAVLITIAAMVYAAVLNEVLIALLSLIGGYLTPILVSTGQNAPNPLFGYVLILSLGAMTCGILRRWRSVNTASLIGTWLIYFAWYMKFCDPILHAPEWLEFKPIALTWLVIFFVIYLFTPLLSSSIRKIKAQPEDIVLMLASGLITVCFLSMMLSPQTDRIQLAIGCTAIGVAYLTACLLVRLRCREDENLIALLLVAGIGFMTAAVPFYVSDNPVILVWALEGAILTFLGLRYSNIWIKTMSGIVLGLSVCTLIYQLFPLHSNPFKPVSNPEFGTWMFTAAAVLVSQFFWRVSKTTETLERRWAADFLYATGILLAALGWFSEWNAHCQYNVIAAARAHCLHEGLLIAAAILIGLMTIRPLVPTGNLSGAVGLLAIIAASIYAVFSLAYVHKEAFFGFLNWPFLTAMLIPAGTLFAAIRIKRQEGLFDDHKVFIADCLQLLTAGLVWGLLTLEIYLLWYCKSRYAGPIENWKFLANLYISILWAAYAAFLIIIGFWKNKPSLRYAALGLFAILLGKIFLFDTINLKTGYRITAFLVTGLILVGVSYLYQFAKKRGLFDALLHTSGRS